MPRPRQLRAPPRRLGRQAQEHLREQTILRAAIEELAVLDYGGMTVEGVAQRAGVNKTTVYRKWETKADLIRAALSSVFEMFRIGPTAGDLRSDLLGLARKMRHFTQTFEGKCLMRLRLHQHPEPELAEIAKRLNAKQMVEVHALIEAAVRRRELRRDVDIMLLLDMLWGALYARLVMKNDVVDDALLEHIVDVLMRANRPDPPAPAARRKRTPR
jgi:AcrR family transcriptional regulator